MSSSLNPIQVYTHPGGGPNPYKVLIILEELGLPYTKIPITDPKTPSFLTINPNGRLPAIIDPNFPPSASSSTGFPGLTLWESGAIAEYLLAIYDDKTSPKLGSTSPWSAEAWQLKQYLHFQMSGQGPYYGQAVFFQKCPQDLPLAKERYIEQAVRVVGVLEDILAKETEKDGKRWLVGGQMTYADLSFVPWNKVLLNAPFFQETVVEKYELEKKYPKFMAWHREMMGLESVKAAYAE